jgi:hypothetical protein
MADPNDSDLTPEELAEVESSSLYDEIADKWDPARLLRLISRRAGKGQRLDLATREKFERRLGVDLGHVRIYTGEFAEEITKAHSAEAVTIGTTGMVLMRGNPERSMAGSEGQALLAHELTHVAQDQRGVYRRGTFGEAAPLAHEEHEAEAEAQEAQEAEGGADGQEDPGADDAARAEVEAKIIAKVLEMFAEAERVHEMRNGDWRFRP